MDIHAKSVLKDVSADANAGVTTLSEALDIYLKLKGAGKDKVFIKTANRNLGYVKKVLADRPIPSYFSSDAASFRDWLIESDMGIKTVKRVFSSVRAIVNIAIAEHGIDCVNGFAKTYFPDEESVSKRQPISPSDMMLT
mgnify:CR=1 FL=1